MAAPAGAGATAAAATAAGATAASLSILVKRTLEKLGPQSTNQLYAHLSKDHPVKSKRHLKQQILRTLQRKGALNKNLVAGETGKGTWLWRLPIPVKPKQPVRPAAAAPTPPKGATPMPSRKKAANIFAADRTTPLLKKKTPSSPKDTPSKAAGTPNVGGESQLQRNARKIFRSSRSSGPTSASPPA